MNVFMPLATRMRPRTLSEFVGQEHLLTEGKPLYHACSEGKLHSMILWGPPGNGKTTLADLMTSVADAHVERLSAVLSGVKDIRAVVERANRVKEKGQTTVLFVDEVHRFNKSQQDAFLPHVEQGTLHLIGATTENPSFQLNNALLSRARVYVLKPLNEDNLLTILDRAISDHDRGLGRLNLEVSRDVKKRIIEYGDGDARQCLNALEILADFAKRHEERSFIEPSVVDSVLVKGSRRFDKHGEAFYDQISALHKSVRGSDPDAALYWLASMLEGGCDPFYLARRILRMASEDIGNADPRALQIALDAWEVYERIGSPEGELALAQAVVYCACAPKSNAVYTAFNAAKEEAVSQGSLEVPLELRNAPTALMKSLDYGKGYRYAHDEPEGFAKGVCYFPEKLKGRRYYHPVDRGLESKIKAKLEYLRGLAET